MAFLALSNLPLPSFIIWILRHLTHRTKLAYSNDSRGVHKEGQKGFSQMGNRRLSSFLAHFSQYFCSSGLGFSATGVFFLLASSNCC